MPNKRDNASYRPHTPTTHVRAHATWLLVATAVLLAAIVYGVEGATFALPLRMLTGQLFGGPSPTDTAGMPAAQTADESWPTNETSSSLPSSVSPTFAEPENDLVQPRSFEEPATDTPPAFVNPSAPPAQFTPPEPDMSPPPDASLSHKIDALQTQIQNLEQQLAATRQSVANLQALIVQLASGQYQAPPSTVAPMEPLPPSGTSSPTKLPPVKPAHPAAPVLPPDTERAHENSSVVSAGTPGIAGESSSSAESVSSIPLPPPVPIPPPIPQPDTNLHPPPAPMPLDNGSPGFFGSIWNGFKAFMGF